MFPDLNLTTVTITSQRSLQTSLFILLSDIWDHPPPSYIWSILCYRFNARVAYRQRQYHGHDYDVDGGGVAVVVPEDVRRIETHPGRPGNSKQQWQHWEKEIITEQIGRKLLSDAGAETIVIN